MPAQSPASTQLAHNASAPVSHVGTGRVRGPDVGAGTMGWMQAGFIIFAFAAPSACIGVAYSLGMAGLVGGSLICIVTTLASIGGSMMLLKIRLQFRDCYTFGDLGDKVLGTPGKIWGNAIQLGNFVLFLPVALLLCAEALQGVVQIAAFKGCNDYYIFTIAALCLLTTQARKLSNTQVLSVISIVSVFVIAVLQITAALMYENEAKVPALAFGNPDEHWLTRTSEALLGTTTAAWAYVPAFLTVELATCMQEPKDFGRSLVLSGVLNVVVFLGVGIVVVARWGYDVTDPITLVKVEAWEQGNWLNTALSFFLLVGNFVSYMLDSVPLARWCQKVWVPGFADTWSWGDIGTYLLCTLPTFLFGLVLSIAIPNLFVLLACTTALTVPWVTQIYPAVLYLRLFASERGAAARLLACAEGDAHRMESSPEVQMATLAEKVRAYLVLFVGVASFVVCLLAAIGKASIAELRGPSQIGCEGWMIWSG